MVRQAYALNAPVTACHASVQNEDIIPSRYSFATLRTDHVILETVKKAEEEDAWIVRVYEYKQRHNKAVHLDFHSAIRSAVECNLIEENETDVSFQDTCLTFSIKPYEIKTFKIHFSP